MFEIETVFEVESVFAHFRKLFANWFSQTNLTDFEAKKNHFQKISRE